MDHKTKEYYRNTIKEIAKKTNMSEIYIAKKTIELCNHGQKETKQNHIGYYLIDEGRSKLLNKLEYKENSLNSKIKAKIYIAAVFVLTVILSIILGKNILTMLILIIPISELVIQTIQYIIGKVVKPKLIPKMDFAMEFL